MQRRLSSHQKRQRAERQRRIGKAVELRRSGLTRREIAKKLGVSFWTVKTYFDSPTRAPSGPEEGRRNLCDCGRSKAKRATSCRPCANERLRRYGYTVEDHGFETPCWIWDGYVNPNGNAQARRDGRFELVHRAAYIEAVGAIPPKMTIDRLCDQRLCVNPGHMEVVTRAENLLRHRERRRRRELALVRDVD